MVRKARKYVFHKRRRWSPEDDALICRLPMIEVAKRLGVSPNAVLKRRKLTGMPMHRLFDPLPTYGELLALLKRIAPHGEKLPPALAIDLEKMLGRFASDEVGDQPRTP